MISLFSRAESGKLECSAFHHSYFTLQSSTGGLGYAVGHGPQIAPGEPAAERDSFGEVVQSRFPRTLTRHLPAGEEKREAVRRLNPANACGNPHPSSPTGSGEEARATIRNFRIVRF